MAADRALALLQIGEVHRRRGLGGRRLGRTSAGAMRENSGGDRRDVGRENRLRRRWCWLIRRWDCLGDRIWDLERRAAARAAARPPGLLVAGAEDGATVASNDDRHCSVGPDSR